MRIKGVPFPKEHGTVSASPKPSVLASVCSLLLLQLLMTFFLASLHGCSLSKIDGDLITQLVATLLLLLLLKNMSKNQDVLIGIKLNVF